MREITTPLPCIRPTQSMNIHCSCVQEYLSASVDNQQNVALNALLVEFTSLKKTVDQIYKANAYLQQQVRTGFILCFYFLA